jgi:hypothetical protein
LRRDCGTVRIQVSDAALTDELVAFFQRRHCRVERVARGVIEVDAHPALDPRQAQLELDLLLRVWQALHPDVVLRAPEPRRRRRGGRA